MLGDPLLDLAQWLPSRRLGGELGTELCLAARASEEYDQMAGDGERDIPAVVLLDQGEREVDARGEILELKTTVNAMVVRLRMLAAEVTRVTLEVGSQGKLGGQAHVPDVEGVWLELMRNVGALTQRRPLLTKRT